MVKVYSVNVFNSTLQGVPPRLRLVGAKGPLRGGTGRGDRRFFQAIAPACARPLAVVVQAAHGAKGGAPADPAEKVRWHDGSWHDPMEKDVSYRSASTALDRHLNQYNRYHSTDTSHNTTEDKRQTKHGHDLPAAPGWCHPPRRRPRRRRATRCSSSSTCRRRSAA